MCFNFKLNIMFYIGQQVICIIDDIGWFSDVSYEITEGPQKGEILTIDGICEQGGLIFYKYGEESFWANDFAPLETYRESYSIAIELVQELEQVDKQKIFNPKKV